MTDRDERSRAARRELERLEGEGGLFSAPGLRTRTRTLRGHFLGKDADSSDRVEVWGTRIGRALGSVAFVALVLYLVVQLSH